MIGDNRYTFEVDKRATKPQIAQAIEEIFDVTVTNVNTMNVTGKPRRLRYTPRARRVMEEGHRHPRGGRHDRSLPDRVAAPGVEPAEGVVCGPKWIRPAPW